MKINSIFVRNFTFGVEDSLVSTIGLLSGVAAAGMMRETIVVTGLILIFVEALSMAVGSLLSEHSTEEYEHKGEVPLYRSVAGSAIMFVSYLVSGFIPLFPYIFFDLFYAFETSIICSILALFLLGVFNARLIKGKIFKHGLQMASIGSLAILVGIIIGKWVN